MNTDTVIHIKANIDDLSGEKHGYLMEQLLALGALDVNFSPLVMKKNRPGILLSVLLKENKAGEIIDFLMKEGASLGLRIKEEKRVIADRKFVKMDVKGIGVAVKESFWQGNLVNYKVEYQDCVKLAKELSLSLAKAEELIITNYLNTRNEK